ncbi:unnamed protein product [Paramecium sonneborni]|uniref:Transmembrane protein n=1 Tax=Paramecium sonneborni TaxID=65129 RepID=A0A8S1KHT1_9CILI|nr:unnamed protein product [Paramecium sonneborni]
MAVYTQNVLYAESINLQEGKKVFGETIFFGLTREELDETYLTLKLTEEDLEQRILRLQIRLIGQKKEQQQMQKIKVNVVQVAGVLEGYFFTTSCKLIKFIRFFNILRFKFLLQWWSSIQSFFIYQKKCYNNQSYLSIFIIFILIFRLVFRDLVELKEMLIILRELFNQKLQKQLQLNFLMLDQFQWVLMLQIGNIIIQQHEESLIIVKRIQIMLFQLLVMLKIHSKIKNSWDTEGEIESDNTCGVYNTYVIVV